MQASEKRRFRPAALRLGPLYQQATNAVYQVDDQLANLLNRPVVAQAMNRAKALAENQGRRFQFATESVAPFRGVGGAQMQQSRQITGQGLQDLKMALDDMLMDPASGIAGSEVRNVQNLRGQMVDWMEKANPDFKAARQTFAQKSTPINTMDVAQALMEKLAARAFSLRSNDQRARGRLCQSPGSGQGHGEEGDGHQQAH
jgi:hypothetical protein